MSDNYDIFLSYSHRDSGIAKHVADKFNDAGLRCFMAERDIGAGELWEAKIRKTLQSVDRVLLLITPNSKNSLWVAAEAGAAWALEKQLVAATMFVDASDLIEPIKRHQARAIEAPAQLEALINELSPSRKFATDRIGGQWIDPTDNDTVFFKQVGSRVVGFYDFGSEKKKVGVYLGTLEDGVFRYEWHWLNGQFNGKGQLTLSKDGKTLVGNWWYANRKNELEALQYHRVSDAMPNWLSGDDFDEFAINIKE